MKVELEETLRRIFFLELSLKTASVKQRIFATTLMMTLTLLTGVGATLYYPGYSQCLL